MSQRIADTIEVLDLIQSFSMQHPHRPSTFWRRKAQKHVASRGVTYNTVYANLVGKGTAHTLSDVQIDYLIETWIGQGSTELEAWVIRSCTNDDDKNKARHFFDKDSQIPFAVDINEPEAIERELVSTYRILRDTALARRIKIEHGYRCQICGIKIMFGDGKPYAEAHHIKPLGNPHNGPDHPNNIVCLCPNCHVKLDYGSMEISSDIFEHIHIDHIKYHNEKIFSKVI